MSFQRLLQLTFWTALAVTFVIAIWPRPLLLPGNPSDKVQHMLAFSVLTALAAGAYRRVSFLYIIAGLALFGALIELTQSIPSLHRDADLSDWVADIAAICVIFAIVSIRRRLRAS